MTYHRTFELASYSLLLTGFAAIAAAGGILSLAALLYLMLLLPSWFIRPVSVPRPFQYAFVALFLAIFLGDLLLLEVFADATVRLLLLLSLYKVYSREKDSDYLILYLIAFSLLLVASTYTLSISYLIVLVVFVFLSVFALVLFETRKAYDENPGAQFSLPAYLQVTTVITILTMVLAIPIFLAVPRGSLGLFGDSRDNVAGFSNSVRLGDLGEILRNSEVVMRVGVDRSAERLPRQLKWRGIALDRFDGRSWTNTHQVEEEFTSDPEGRFLVTNNRRQDEFLLEQTFYVEPFTSLVFGAPGMIQLSGFRADSARIWMDVNDTVHLRPRPREPIRYFVHSDLQSRAEKVRRIEANGKFPLSVVENFVELPKLDPRIPRLALQLTESEPDAFGRARALEEFLRAFVYTLQNPSGSADDPLADFLFRTRAGHCEYYATSLCVMLRAIGIPSRVVNGFRRGEYNEWGDYFIVRQSDAHSWVEAYFPGAGWIEFDPTPGGLRDESNSFVRAVARLLDSLDVMWTQVVTFDRFKQLGFFQSVRNGLEQKWRQASKLFELRLDVDSLQSQVIWNWVVERWVFILALIVGVLILLLGHRYRRYLRITWCRRVLGATGMEIAQEFYQEYLDIIARKGFNKKEGETPLEFCERIRPSLDSELPHFLTWMYYRSRFGGYTIEEEDLARVFASLRDLRSLSVSSAAILSGRTRNV